jgi:hypothetical protein
LKKGRGRAEPSGSGSLEQGYAGGWQGGFVAMEVTNWNGREKEEKKRKWQN